MDVETLKPGCYVDGSHVKTSDFDLTVIGFGKTLGWEPSIPLDGKIIAAALLGISGDWEVPGDGTTVHIEECLHEIADEAIEWLNDNFAAENHLWGIDDQSLFYGPVIDEEDAWA